MIELTHASFQYENSDRGVQDISILVKSGECVVLTGLSGCGKTTVTRLVNGLAPSYYPGVFSGSVRIKSAFESLHLWLVVCDDECALLLQKKDLRAGNADSFLSDIISKMNTGTDASG